MIVAKMKKISDALRRAIKASGKSLSEIGRESGVHRAVLSRFVRGERTLTTPAVDKLASFFGMRLTKARKRDG